MKVNEFIKKNGLAEARKLLEMGRGFVKLSDEGCFHTDELQRIVESHELIEHVGGVIGCRSIISDAPNDSTHIKINLGLCIYYCQSSGDEGDQAGLWIDDGIGYWGLSSYQNYELSIAENRFISIVEVRKAIADVEACQ